MTMVRPTGRVPTPTPSQQEGTLVALAHLGLGAVAMTHAEPALADVGHHASEFYASAYRALTRHRLEFGQRIQDQAVDPSGRIPVPEPDPLLPKGPPVTPLT